MVRDSAVARIPDGASICPDTSVPVLVWLAHGILPGIGFGNGTPAAAERSRACESAGIARRSLGQDGDMALECVTASTRPDLDEEASTAFRERWPEFIFHDPISRAYIDRAEQYFPEYQVLLLDDGRVAAGGRGVPFAYDGHPAGLPDGYDGTLACAIDGHEAGAAPAAFSFMAAAVHPDFSKRGLAGHVLSHLTTRARDAGLTSVFAPIRPTWKSRYPAVPMARYATWRRADGLSIDPWIRAHQRMGARIAGAAPRPMVIPGTVAERETRAGMLFPETGEYVVPEALNLVRVDRENDSVVYEEENLWVEHDI